MFVDLFRMDYTRLLARSVRYEFGFTISYWPADELAASELDDAVFRMAQGITLLPDFPIQGIGSDVTDGVISVTGVIRVREALDDGAPLIAQTRQEFNQKG